jgi:hypothetical protein
LPLVFELLTLPPLGTTQKLDGWKKPAKFTLAAILDWKQLMPSGAYTAKLANGTPFSVT